MSDDQASFQHHPLTLLLEQTYKARDLITRAYERNGSDLSDDEMAKSEPLISAHFLRRDGNSNGIRVNQRLQKVFDGALRKNRIAAINTNLGEELNVAELSMLGLQEAERHGKGDLASQYREDVEGSLLAIYDILDDGSATIFRQVSAGFGLQENRDLKKRENEHYLRQLNSLINSFDEVRTALQDEPFTSDPDIQAFITNFELHCLQVVARISDIQNTIKDYLYRIRTLEKRARQIRAVGNQLRKDPGFYPTNTANLAQDWTYCRRIVPIKAKGYPEIHQFSSAGVYADLVNELSQKLAVESPEKDLKPSKLLSREQETVTKERRDDEMVIQQLLAECIKTSQPVSAREFWPRVLKTGETIRWSTLGFLYAVSQYLAQDPLPPNGRRPTSHHVKSAYRTIGEHHLSGTHDLLDILVYPARMSLDEALSAAGVPKSVFRIDQSQPA